ncbi:hypothetical protein COV19_06915 [Candidatus Woesearchaeota archaeon CG10_big_fil_rev_8_21_14_0_10_44_13]|nr:MAG: hypothetical protein COV19_06915 [Candidatus Woesearchaeota archaeon CG10_big_fil_rev_8_21_14_0_10_44_13]
MNNTLGIDIGGTTIKSAIVSKGKIVSIVYIQRTGAKKGTKAVLNDIFLSINAFEDYFSDGRIRSIGIGSPGPLDWKTGKIIASVNIPLNGVNLVSFVKNHVRNRFKRNVKVLLDNDARCFVFAEALHGAGKNHSCVAGYTLGTGVGGGIIHNKKICHGMGAAGELGHVKINAINGRRCHCGRIGCLEAYASSYGIVQTAKEHGLKVKDPEELYEIAKGLKKSGGNKKNKAKKVFEETGAYMGMAISNLIAVEHPEIIIIGGNISNAWGFMGRSIINSARKYSITGKMPKITRASLKYGGIIGAAGLAD